MLYTLQYPAARNSKGFSAYPGFSFLGMKVVVARLVLPPRMTWYLAIRGGKGPSLVCFYGNRANSLNMYMAALSWSGQAIILYRFFWFPLLDSNLTGHMFGTGPTGIIHTAPPPHKKTTKLITIKSCQGPF